VTASDVENENAGARDSRRIEGADRLHIRIFRTLAFLRDKDLEDLPVLSLGEGR
jgi:hypothetical protein